MFRAKKIISAKITKPAFVKAARGLIPKLRKLDTPEMNEYADKLESQLDNPDMAVIVATLSEVTTKLAKMKQEEN